jgi:hypothetical protein
MAQPIQHITNAEINSSTEKIASILSSVNNINDINDATLQGVITILRDVRQIADRIRTVKDATNTRVEFLNTSLQNLVTQVNSIPDISPRISASIADISTAMEGFNMDAFNQPLNELETLLSSIPDGEPGKLTRGGYKYGALKSKKSKRSKLGMLSSKTTKSKSASKSTKTKTKKSKK